MTPLEIEKMIKAHEGFEPTVYYDTRGIPTGGWGHAFLIGSPIPANVAKAYFKLDMKSALDDYATLGLDLDPVRRAVVIDMLFNLGLHRLKKFEKFLDALRRHDYGAAAQEMINSRWYNQVGIRSHELVAMMLNGTPFSEIRPGSGNKHPLSLRAKRGNLSTAPAEEYG